MGGQTPVQDMSLLAPAIYTVLHLFSGSGGLAKGFHDAGFAIGEVAAVRFVMDWSTASSVHPTPVAATFAAASG